MDSIKQKYMHLRNEGTRCGKRADSLKGATALVVFEHEP